MFCKRLAASLLLICTLCASQTSGFSVRAPSGVSIRRFAVAARPSTCLFAEQEDGATASDAEVAEDISPPVESKTSTGGTDILTSPAFLTRKLEVLRKDAVAVETALEEAKARLQAGKDEWGPQLDELQKEYKNIQQRMNTQNNAGDTMSTVQVARQLLTMLDNYDRAFIAVTPETDAERAIEAEYKEAYDMVLSTFDKLGVKPVETVGKEFDYENHQAVMQRPSEDYEEGIVCEELQKGFRCGDILVRAAMVVVAA
ncbi:hypothetical protein MPSEU_000471900 [Mayamaea pseudoterrestris]|nr:hypothetical protein MPSEU_000471900 [Mayamaea pseudoterrestris]